MVGPSRIQRLLACLGEPSRFRVLCVLVEGDRCVTEIADRVGLSQSCTTRHLQALLREGVVGRVRRGKRVIFQVADSDPRVARILEWALLRISPVEARPGSDEARPPSKRRPSAEARRSREARETPKRSRRRADRRAARPGATRVPDRGSDGLERGSILGANVQPKAEPIELTGVPAGASALDEPVEEAGPEELEDYLL